jgi:hypothetical protein
MEINVMEIGLGLMQEKLNRAIANRGERHKIHITVHCPTARLHLLIYWSSS